MNESGRETIEKALQGAARVYPDKLDDGEDVRFVELHAISGYGTSRSSSKPYTHVILRALDEAGLMYKEGEPEPGSPTPRLRYLSHSTDNILSSLEQVETQKAVSILLEDLGARPEL